MTGGLGVVVGAIVGAVVGGGATLISTRQQATAAATEREKDRKHDLDVRKEERRQARIAEAYLTIQLYINRRDRVATYWAASIRIAGEPEPMIPPVSEEAEGIASLYASDAVIAGVREFNRRWAALAAALFTYDAGGRSTSAVLKSVHERAPGVSEEAEKVLSLLREDLGVAGAASSGRQPSSEADSAAPASSPAPGRTWA